MDDGDNTIGDGGGAEYSSKSDFSKAGVIQTQVLAINVAGSKPMIPGYVTHLADKLGNIKPVVIPDARMGFCAAVETLKDNLKPEIESNKEYTEIIKMFEKEKDNIIKKYIYKELIPGRDKNGFPTLVPSGRNWLPKQGEILYVGIKKTKGGIDFIKEPGAWDSKINAYWDELEILYRILFGQLNCLIDKNNYFKRKARF